MCYFGDHWYPCFGFLVTSPLGFKARLGSALFVLFFCGGECTFLEIHLWCYTCRSSLQLIEEFKMMENKDGDDGISVLCATMDDLIKGLMVVSGLVAPPDKVCISFKKEIRM